MIFPWPGGPGLRQRPLDGQRAERGACGRHRTGPVLRDAACGGVEGGGASGEAATFANENAIFGDGTNVDFTLDIYGHVDFCMIFMGFCLEKSTENLWKMWIVETWDEFDKPGMGFQGENCVFFIRTSGVIPI